MKKLILKKFDLDDNDLLQREQLKSVFGGYGGGQYMAMCCWSYNMSNCSECVVSYPGAPCVSNATLVAC